MSVSESIHDEIVPAVVRRIMPYIVLVLCVFTAYGNIFDNGFVFDDGLLIEANSYLHGWGHISDILAGSTTAGAHIAGGFYRPVQIFLYLLIYQLCGGSLVWFHLLNLAIHTANTCFVYRLGTKLNFKPWGVFLAALVWGVHPLHTEAVTYISATADPLFAFFCLWATLILVPDITPRKIWLVLPLVILGLLTKETTVMFPLLVMSCLFLTNDKRLDFRTYIRTWPLWILCLGYTYWRMHAPGFDGPQTYIHYYGMPEYANLKLYADHNAYRFFTFLATIPYYLKLLVWPTELHMERSFAIYTSAWNIAVGLGVLFCILALVQIVRSARHPLHGIAMGWGLLWCICAHAPDTGILIPMNSLFLEHWMYLPSVGLFLGIAETLAVTMPQRPAFYAQAASVVTLTFAGVMAAMTYHQNGVWRDPPSFYNNIFSYGEESARARNNLALYYAQKGQFDQSIAQYQKAIKISDTYAETRYNMALTYLKLPDWRLHIQDAVDNLKRSLEIDPRFYRSYLTLGDIYGSLLNDPATAEMYRTHARELMPPQS
jgi:tetratricopeptide (TPR) repeat protein